MHTVNRLHQFVLIVSVLIGSWLGMQAVHETGHALAGWLTGGRVARVVLWPLSISRTDLAENPHPLAVVWAGPMFGVVTPLCYGPSLRLSEFAVPSCFDSSPGFACWRMVCISAWGHFAAWAIAEKCFATVQRSGSCGSSA